MAVMLLSVPKVTKGPGRCDSPRPPNAAQVWNALSATNRRNFKPRVLRSLALKFLLRFSQSYRHLPAYGCPCLSACFPQTTPLLLGEKHFPEPYSVRQIQIYHSV